MKHRILVLLALAPFAPAWAQTASIPETVVTATRIPTPQERLPAATTVIDRQIIEERGYVTLADALVSVPGFNIASSVILITAQRLARKLCACKEPFDPPKHAMLEAGFTPDEIDGSWRPYRKVGCERCGGSGYKGRTGIYQVMPITEAIQQIILSGGNALDIAAQAAREGVRDLRRSGLEKVKQGVTTLEEVLAVTNE